jgi:digeranylgeranylglycerophospholipid reductase
MKMAPEQNWDVIVVGGGPAGSSAARSAAETGSRVLVVDRRETIGSPIQCAEFLARNVVLDLKLPSKAIAQDVERSRTFLAGEEVSVRRNPGCILNRDVADLALWRRAVDAGADARTSTRVTAIRKDVSGPYEVVMVRDGEEERTTATVLIGADGPRSVVGAALGISNHKMVVANQVTVPLHGPASDTEVYLDPVFAGGYAWMFPKGEMANLGVGVDVALGASPMRALALFLSMLGDRVGGPVRSTGGLIPVGGPLPMRLDRALLAGDAAGLTHPITGGGIHQALVSGKLAGEAAGAYLDGDEEALDRYEPAFMDLFGRHLGRAVERRKEMVTRWSSSMDDPEAFAPLARRTWIGFKEYFKDGGGEPDGE